MQTLLLLHGAIGASNQLDEIKKYFEGKYDVHLLDFSGHGGVSFSSKGFSIPVFAEEVKDYIERYDLQNVNIFGYSMGGYVAMYLAKIFPDKVKRIITLASKFYWDEATAIRETKMLNPEVIEEKVPKFAKALEQRHAPNDWKEIMSKTAEMLESMGKDNLLSIQDYETISTQSLILIGDRDKMITLDETVNVYKALPNAEMGMLPNSHHPIERTNFKYLLYHIDSFIVD